MKTAESPSRVRLRLLAVGLLAVLGAIGVRLALREDAPVLKPAELKAFNASAGGVLGRHLAERFPQGRVLIVVRPGAENGQGTAEENSLLEGFKQAVAGRLQIAGIVAPRAPDWFMEDMRKKVASGEYLERDTGLLLAATTMWYETRGLADLIRAQPGPVSIVVSTTALPEDFPGSPALGESLPPVALLLAPVLSPGRMLDTGRVEAMVVYKSPAAWTPVGAPEADAQSAFESRYLLVHSGNREEVQRQHPELFR